MYALLCFCILAAGENIAKAEAERVAAEATAAKAAAESDVETDLGTETETGTESELDTDTDDANGTGRRRTHRAELHQHMDVVNEGSSDDTGEQEEEESEEVLAASAAEDALYRAADEATRANPAPPSSGQWAVESLGQEDSDSSGYRERQLQASALRDALAVARAAKVAQATA